MNFAPNNIKKSVKLPKLPVAYFYNMYYNVFVN